MQPPHSVSEASTGEARAHETGTPRIPASAEPTDTLPPPPPPLCILPGNHDKHFFKFQMADFSKLCKARSF